MTSVFEDPDCYPGITLLQPWAGLFWLAGFGWPGKLIESRKRRIHYRGPLVICAGLSMTDEAHSASLIAYQRLVGTGKVPHDVFAAACDTRGVALAKANVCGCRPLKASDEPRTFFWKDDVPRYAWLNDRISALDPFPVKGAQGFVRVPRKLVDARVLATTTLEGAS